MTPSPPCGCGSGQDYATCCGPWHRGEPAPSALALMRSRFCAFRLGLVDYVRDTWHASTRPPVLEDVGDVRWLALRIEDSGTEGDAAFVLFEATGLEAGQCLTLRERSRFVREQGRWWYQEGDARFSTRRLGRNDACPCGSGRKAKRCCLAR